MTLSEKFKSLRTAIPGLCFADHDQLESDARADGFRDGVQSCSRFDAPATILYLTKRVVDLEAAIGGIQATANAQLEEVRALRRVAEAAQVAVKAHVFSSEGSIHLLHMALLSAGYNP